MRSMELSGGKRAEVGEAGQGGAGEALDRAAGEGEVRAAADDCVDAGFQPLVQDRREEGRSVALVAPLGCRNSLHGRASASDSGTSNASRSCVASTVANSPARFVSVMV